MDLLREETVLGLNMAFLLGPSANLVYDLRCMEKVGRTPEWAAYRGGKFWLNSEGGAGAASLFPDTQSLREHHITPQYPRWPAGLNEGIYRGNNAGSAGVCLADVLGAETIYLLGFDMRADAVGRANWHDLYPEKWRASESQLATYRNDLDRVSKMVRAKVVNLTPGSALRCFPAATLEDALSAGRARA